MHPVGDCGGVCVVASACGLPLHGGGGSRSSMASSFRGRGGTSPPLFGMSSLSNVGEVDVHACCKHAR